ncbi:hypothetical protein DRQ50_12535 [bacterium]|nr:MAG: hypothetical protein DRQ50_12535 [bacterium]
MKSYVLVLLLVAIPTLVIAGTHVDSINLVRPNPAPGDPIRIYVEASLPDVCWTQGPVGDSEFTVLDSSTGEDCTIAIFHYGILFEFEGRPAGDYSITITELHESVRDPGSWEHVVEFTVESPVGSDRQSWSSVKSLFH